MNEISVMSKISASLTRIQSQSPFLATLAYHGNFTPTQNIDIAGTNGKDIYFNPEFFSSLSPSQQDSLLLHQVLHVALLHCQRRGSKECLSLEYCC